MVLFACLVSAVFGIIGIAGKENRKDKAMYSLRVFAEFIGVGLLLSWLFYLLF
jgi:hypothetical protein